MKRKLQHLICVLLLPLAISGCSGEDPNPEQRDPIYKDLKARADAYAKELEDASNQVTTLREALAKAEPGTIDMKDIKRDLAKAESQKLGAQQLSRYYKIRADRRRVEGRQAYRKALAEKKEWPDPKEYSDYLVNIRLHEINMNWNARVPKLQDRIPASKD